MSLQGRVSVAGQLDGVTLGTVSVATLDRSLS